MALHQTVDFEPSGFYLFDKNATHGWEFSLDFYHEQSGFTYPELLIVPPPSGGSAIGLSRIISGDDLQKRFRVLQLREIAVGRRVPNLPAMMSPAIVEKLVMLHRRAWDQTERELRSISNSRGAGKIGPLRTSPQYA